MNRLTEHWFKADRPVFTQADVAVAIEGTDFSRHGLIKRAISSGEIVNVRRGLYCLAEPYRKRPVSVYSISHRIHGPSYVSLESALAFHFWIPEAVYGDKLHALLCREYVKGRDWYDFIWYTSQNVGVNFEFLASAINQLGPWEGQQIMVDKNWILSHLERRIASIDCRQAADDVRRFVPAQEQASLDPWSQDLFFRQLRKLQQAV